MNRASELIHNGIFCLKRDGVKETVRHVYHWAKGDTKEYYRAYDMLYTNYQALYNTVRNDDMNEMQNEAKQFKYKPKISIVVPVYNPDIKYFKQMIESVLNQSYINWELCLADDASPDKNIRAILKKYEEKDDRIKVSYRTENGNISAASNSALKLATGEFVALVDHDDILPTEALWTIVYYINKYDNEVDLLYSDEDKLDITGHRYNPYFKSDWNKQLILQENFVAHLGVYRTSILNKINGFRVGYEGSQDYDLLLRFLNETSDERIVHVPYILYHWRKSEEHGSFSTKFQSKSDESAKRALQDYLGSDVVISPCKGLVGCWRIQYNNIKHPKVSIIIPFRDKVYLLKQCVRGLLEETDYDNIEIILVDNGSSEEITRKYLEKIKDNPLVKVIRDDGQFNYSRLNNLAVKEAKGEAVLLLNNDIKIMDKKWLQEMVNVLVQDNVGVVGAKLLYANNRVQHAGVTTGIYEVAGHSLRHLQKNDVGYFGWAVLERDVSAVTGACLLIWKNIYKEVNGLDEEHLRVSFNDVDLCLKVRNAGYRLIYTPYAQLYHLESQSRGDDITKEQKVQNYNERHYMHKKYGHNLKEDMHYSPNLSLDNEDVMIADIPRVGKPWREWIEFICPFHRGDVMIGLQVACTAAMHGKKIRMHVSKDIYEWIQAFPYEQYIEVVPVDVPIPKAVDTEYYFNQAIRLVSLREDSSCNIVSAHPKRDLDKMGIDIVEFMLEALGLPIDTELVNIEPKDVIDEESKDIIDNKEYWSNVVLLHPNAGWTQKSLSPRLIEKIIKVVHESGYKVVQVGGAKDNKVNGVDNYYLKNVSLYTWKYLMKYCKAIIGVDSWTSHFGAIVDANQIVIYGSTASRDVESKRHFKTQNNSYLIMESACDFTPCHSYECRFGKEECIGMEFDEQPVKELLLSKI